MELILLVGFSFVSALLWAQSGGFAYVGNCGGSCFPGVGPQSISAYRIDATTGALTEIAGSPFAVGRNNGPMTVHPTGQFAYVPGGSNVSVYTIDGATGALTEIAGSPFPAGLDSVWVAVDPMGQFAYVANFSSNNVSAYTINGTTGALTEVAGSPFSTGSNPVSVTADPTGQFAYVPHRAPSCSFGSICGSISAYTIDGATGALTPVPGSPFMAGNGRPSSVAVEPTGPFAYMANCGAVSPCGGGGPPSISAYAIDRTTGALTPISGVTYSNGTSPRSVAVDPTGQFAYVAFCDFLCEHSVGAHGVVLSYAIDGATGALTPVPGSPFPAGVVPIWVTTTAGLAPPPAP